MFLTHNDRDERRGGSNVGDKSGTKGTDATTRPLPWHDTPKCGKPVTTSGGDWREAPRCNGPIVDLSENGGGYACAVCGTSFHPNAQEREQLLRAERARALVLAGEVHEDKACARCNGVLPIERFRLCETCTAADNAERQGVLL